MPKKVHRKVSPSFATKEEFSQKIMEQMTEDQKAKFSEMLDSGETIMQAKRKIKKLG